MRISSMIIAAILLAATSAAAQPAAAPLPLAVTLVPDGERPGAFAELLNAIGQTDNTFSISQPARRLPATTIRSCLSATDRELCFRRRLDETRDAKPPAPPHIVLIVEELRRGLRVSCLGASRQWKDEEKQVIAIDLQVGLRGPEKERQAERNAIVQCMLAARQETTP